MQANANSQLNLLLWWKIYLFNFSPLGKQIVIAFHNSLFAGKSGVLAVHTLPSFFADIEAQKSLNHERCLHRNALHAERLGKAQQKSLDAFGKLRRDASFSVTVSFFYVNEIDARLYLD